MKRMLVASTILPACLAAACLRPAAVAAPEEIVVAADGSGAHAEIAAALAAAPEGAVLRVKPGTYAGPLVLERPVTVAAAGKGRVVVQARDGAPAVEARA